MKFKEYLKKNKIKVKKDNSIFTVNRYYSPYASTVKDYKFVTKEDIERIKVMKNFLTSNLDIDSSAFCKMLEETPKYKAVTDKYPYKKTLVDDLREESVSTFAHSIDVNIGYNKRMEELMQEEKN